MAEISAQLVKQLREMTGAGFLECKKALAEAGGDIQKAVDVLKTRGLASAGEEGRPLDQAGLASEFRSSRATSRAS